MFLQFFRFLLGSTIFQSDFFWTEMDLYLRVFVSFSNVLWALFSSNEIIYIFSYFFLLYFPGAGQKSKLLFNNLNLCFGAHHWKLLRSNFKKLAWEGFEPTTTEFCSSALTNWAIRPWVQLILRASFVQLLQFNHLFSVQISFRYCFC